MLKETSNPNPNLDAAKTEIEGVLKKYNLFLVPVVVHQGDRTFSRIDIVPLQETEGSES